MSNLLVPGLAFAIASSPATFKLTRKVAGPWVSSFEGVATPAGLFLHTLFFLLILYLVGRFMPRMSGYGKSLDVKREARPKQEQFKKVAVDKSYGVQESSKKVDLKKMAIDVRNFFK
jgi:uncharacterized membrane protein YhiD involved in acid resistance